MACVLIAALTLPLLPACNTTPTQEGAVAGAALGAGAGAIIGHQQGKQGEGALIGAAAGALAGALIGDQVDERRNSRQAQHLEPAQPAPQTGEATVLRKGHYETRLVKTESGETYEERVWVPAR
jgi:outer membrane lipoprotein SlyB